MSKLESIPDGDEVLLSVRRLVARDLQPGQAAPGPEDGGGSAEGREGADPLVLTPSLRVLAPAAFPDARPDARPPGLQMALSAPTPPGPAPCAAAARPRDPLMAPAIPPHRAANVAIRAFAPERAAAAVPVAETRPETPAETVPETVPDITPDTTSGPGGGRHPEPTPQAAPPALSADARHPPGGADPAGAGLDAAALRALIAEVVREELSGDLGRRVTGNLRKLVRAEIARAMASREIL